MNTAHPPIEDLLATPRAELAPALAAHLASCDGCARRVADVDELRDLLAAALPDAEPHAFYGARTWARLAPRLSRPPSLLDRLRGLVPAGSRLAVAGSVLALALVAFFAGRLSVAPSGPTREVVRERVLLVTVGRHLERSEVVLLELVNGGGEGEDATRRRADELVSWNRLCRAAALRDGESDVASVLDQLEPILLEGARSPDLDATARAALRQRLEAGGVLFKVRVLASRLAARNAAPDPRAPRV